MAHLDEYKLLSDRQHAFRKEHSCETQLTTVINDWAKILDNRGCQVPEASEKEDMVMVKSRPPQYERRHKDILR